MLGYSIKLIQYFYSSSKFSNVNYLNKATDTSIMHKRAHTVTQLAVSSYSMLAFLKQEGAT